jgi:Tetratricopeptide repeat
VQRWRDVIGRFPRLESAHVGLGESLYKAGNEAESEAAFQAAQERFPNDISLPAAVANIASNALDWPKALRLWADVLERFPANSIAHIGLARTLRDSGNLDQSEARLEQAIKLFPGNFELEVQMALTLSFKRQWPKALALWKSLRERWPAHAAVRQGISLVLPQAERDQRQSRPEPFEIPKLLLTTEDTASEHIQKMASIFKGFESLGSDCEFGMVQRIFNVDQPSLLRWAATLPEMLVQALDDQLEGVGDPEHTVVIDHCNEYFTQDRRYRMTTHTFTPPASVPIEEFTLEHLERMQWLRRKFLSDLTAAKRTFVYKNNDGITDEQMFALYASLQRYNADIRLLCVRLQEQDRVSGTLHQLKTGLYVGYIDRFSTVDISVAEWTTVCQQLATRLATNHDTLAHA